MGTRVLPPPPTRAPSANSPSETKADKAERAEKEKARKKAFAAKKRAEKAAGKKGPQVAKSLLVTKKPLSTNKKKNPKDKPKMTAKQVHQCLVLKARPGITPADFARVAWPDAPGWSKVCRTGNGPNSDTVREVKGGAMFIAAGAALGKLKELNWAKFEQEKGQRTKKWSLTAKGLKDLEQSLPHYDVAKEDVADKAAKSEVVKLADAA